MDESPTICEDSIAVLSHGDCFEDYRIHREGGAEVEKRRDDAVGFAPLRISPQMPQGS